MSEDDDIPDEPNIPDEAPPLGTIEAPTFIDVPQVVADAHKSAKEIGIVLPTKEKLAGMAFAESKNTASKSQMGRLGAIKLCAQLMGFLDTSNKDDDLEDTSEVTPELIKQVKKEFDEKY